MAQEVIYEDPANPLPYWARWLAKGHDDKVVMFGENKNTLAKTPVLDEYAPGGWGGCMPSGDAPDDYTIPGPWQDSLRRIVRPIYSKPTEDLKKAHWYLDREIQRREKQKA